MTIDDNDWDVKRGQKILNKLVKRRKLDQVGYQLLWVILKYPAEDWEHRKKICEYNCLCINFNFHHYFYNKEFL